MKAARAPGTVGQVEDCAQQGRTNALSAPGGQQGNINDVPAARGVAMQIQATNWLVRLFDNKNVAVRIALLVVQALQACLVEQELSALFVGPARYQHCFRPATRQVQVADEYRIGIRLHVPAQAWFRLWRGK